MGVKQGLLQAKSVSYTRVQRSKARLRWAILEGHGHDTPDTLTQALVAGSAIASEENVQWLLSHVASAPFATREVRVVEELRGKEYLGYRFGLSAPSGLAHLGKRVIVEKQWTVGTTFQQYVDDLRFAVRHPARRLAVFRSRGLHYAGVLSPNTIPDERRGEHGQAYLWIVYDSDHGTIVTGYQVSGTGTISLPKDARWLI